MNRLSATRIGEDVLLTVPRWQADRCSPPKRVSEPYIGRVKTPRTVFPAGKLSLSYPVWMALSPGGDEVRGVAAGDTDRLERGGNRKLLPPAD